MTTVRIWFTKTKEASYISLLDLQRLMQRCIKRSGLPVWYTQGFNPHIYITFACPLPLGQESLVESLDVKTEDSQVDLEHWKQTLEKLMPLGLEITKVTLPVHKAEQIGFATYTLEFPLCAKNSLDAYNELEHAVVQKKAKRGFKEIDLKESLSKFEYEQTEHGIRVTVKLPAGDGLNLNPSLWLQFLASEFGLNTTEVSVLRTGLLLKNGEQFC